MKFLVAILSVAFAAQGLSYCKAPQKDMLGSMCTKLSGLTTAKYIQSACDGYIGEKGCQTTCCKIYSGKGQKQSNAGGSTQKHSRWSRYTRHSHGNQNGNQKGFWKNQYDHDRQSKGNQQRGRGSYGRHSTHSRGHYGHEDQQSKGRYSEYGRGTSKYQHGQSRYNRWSHHRGTSSRGNSRSHGSRGQTSHGRHGSSHGYSRHGSSSHGSSSHGYPSRHGSSSHSRYSRHGSQGHSSHGYSRGGRGQSSHGYSRHGQSSRGGYSRGGDSRYGGRGQSQQRGQYNQYGHGGH